MQYQEIMETRLEGRTCWLAVPEGAAGEAPLPAAYLVAEDDFSAQYEAIRTRLLPEIEAGRVRPFILAAFACEDWNRALTPWPAPALFKKSPPFAGAAGETLAWLTDAFIPYVQARTRARDDAAGRVLLGYSLGGLFALWACHETALFSGCASCSGSLWYDGFSAYLQGAHPPQDSRIYLSLGDREGRARNPRMAAVDPATRAAYAHFQEAGCVREAALVMQTGGHFDGVPERLADALGWLWRT